MHSTQHAGVNKNERERGRGKVKGQEREGKERESKKLTGMLPKLLRPSANRPFYLNSIRVCGDRRVPSSLVRLCFGAACEYTHVWVWLMNLHKGGCLSAASGADPIPT
jgi:hypothetical protein